MSKKISVIIPSHKPQAYIYECLNSIFNQTMDHSNFEVLIILNGCNYPYYDEINTFVNKRKPSLLEVNLLQTDTPGVSNARNIGLQEMNGNYVCFLDDDDYLSNGFLEDAYDKISDNTVLLSNYIEFSNQSETNGLKYSSMNLTSVFYKYRYKSTHSLFLLRTYFSSPWAKIIPISLFNRMKFDINLSNGEDTLLMTQISKYIDKIDFLDESSIYYRRLRPESLTSKTKDYKYYFDYNSYQIRKYIPLLIDKKYDKLFVLSRIFGAIYAMFINLKLKK